MRTQPTKSQKRKRKQTHTTRISQNQTDCDCVGGTIRGHKVKDSRRRRVSLPSQTCQNASNIFNGHGLKTEIKSSSSIGNILPKYLELALVSSGVDDKWAESEIMNILSSSNFQNENESSKQRSAGHSQDGGDVTDDEDLREDPCQNMQDRVDLQQSLPSVSTSRCSRHSNPDIGHIPSLFSSASEIIEYENESDEIESVSEIKKNGKFDVTAKSDDDGFEANIHGKTGHSVVGLGPPRADCSPTIVSLRRFTIQQKMSCSSEPSFSSPEEFDIHERAEAYAASILPDPVFYILPVRNHSPSYHYLVHGSSRKKVGRKTVPRSRGRRSYSDLECFVTRNLVERHADLYDNSYILPEGTRLLKPPNKLVELVSKAIDESPDGLLQVQQVYQVLMNRYPYFRFMDKTSITSWRNVTNGRIWRCLVFGVRLCLHTSWKECDKDEVPQSLPLLVYGDIKDKDEIQSSIRHALYQKWFRKVRLSSEIISCRGCYWAISRHHTPKEWSLGTDLPRYEELSSETFCADEQGYSNPSYADSVDRYAFIYEPVIESAEESQHLVEFSQDAEDLSCLSAPSATYNQIKTEIDPDPVLTTSIGSVALPNKRDTTSTSSGSSTPKSQASSASSDDSSGLEYRIPPEAWWEEYYQQIGYQPVGISSSTGNYIQPAAHGIDLPDVPMCPSIFYDQGYKVECRN